MTDASDEWFSRFEFRQWLGHGGMGVIYLAQDKTQDKKPCVVKQLILRDLQLEEKKEAERLFKREAEMLRQLHHPGIVQLLDYHVTEERKFFLVMDYVPGNNLDVTVKEHGIFSSEETIKIGIQCCEVLEYLHGLSPPILYRDLKPSNLMLTPDGQIVFIDFGIARPFEPKEAATRVVSTGYSPPEQYFGKPETRSDLYALGATLSQLLTGVRPKPLMVSAPVQLNRNVLLPLDDLIRRLTSHHPQDRPNDARVVRYELYRIYKGLYPEFAVPDEVFTTATNLRSSQSFSNSENYEKTELLELNKRIQENIRDSSARINKSENNHSSIWTGLKRLFNIFKS